MSNKVAKSDEEVKLQANVRNGVERANQLVNILGTLDIYKKADIATKGELTSAAVALSIANVSLDMTINPEASLFYHAELESLTRSIVAEYNNANPIDCAKVIKLTYPLWLARYYIASGKHYPWVFHYNLGVTLPKPDATLINKLVNAVELWG